MADRLSATVYVKDPETHQTVELQAGSSPEPRLAALVTNPVAWEGGKLPARVKRAIAAQDDGDGQEQQTPTDGDSGDSSGDAASTGDDSSDSEADTKQAAPKRAARKPATRRASAGEGDGGK